MNYQIINLMKNILMVLIYLAMSNLAFSQIISDMGNEQLKIHQPEYCLFYDNHTMPACPDVGENFDAKAFTDLIEGCGVDYLTFHARCNPWMAYYDAKTGIKHPSLKYDLFGKLAEACLYIGIALTAYFTGGINN
jgi:hypothetical protein